MVFLSKNRSSDLLSLSSVRLALRVAATLGQGQTRNSAGQLLLGMIAVASLIVHDDDVVFVEPVRTIGDQVVLRFAVVTTFGHRAQFAFDRHVVTVLAAVVTPEQKNFRLNSHVTKKKIGKYNWNSP